MFCRKTNKIIIQVEKGEKRQEGGDYLKSKKVEKKLNTNWRGKEIKRKYILIRFVIEYPIPSYFLYIWDSSFVFEHQPKT